VFNGKDPLFWFFAHEGFADAYATPAYFTVPTAAEIQGDFSHLLSLTSGSKNYTLYDPSTVVLNGSTITRTAFPGNIIPSNRLNPIATNFLKQYMPGPNTLEEFMTIRITSSPLRTRWISTIPSPAAAMSISATRTSSR